LCYTNKNLRKGGIAISKRSFFTFALGTAAVAAGISLVKKKGGLHLSFDVEPSKLGESVAEWKAKQSGGEDATVLEEHGEDGTGEN
jgi:hypothetical protein